MNRIGAPGKFLLRAAMSNLRLLSDPFACLRAFATAAALSCVAVTFVALAPPFAAAQDQEATEDAPGEDAPAEEAPADDAAPAEAPSEEAAPEETAPDDAVAGEAAPAAMVGWDIAKPCENTQHPYQADLCQQWRAAEAAEKAAAAAQRTVGLTQVLMLIGAIVTGLLLLMFIPLIMAARAARRAARGGDASPLTAASHDDGRSEYRRAHEDHAEELRAEEMRAYVDVDKIEFIETPESEGIVKVKVIFRNTGQTPAFRTRSATNVGIRDVADENLVPVMPLPDNRSANAPRPRLGRDATAVDIVECGSTPSLADRVMNGDATIVVWGWTEYYDVFERKQRTVFQYLCNAETLDSGQIFKPMTRGDETG